VRALPRILGAAGLVAVLDGPAAATDPPVLPQIPPAVAARAAQMERVASPAVKSWAAREGPAIARGSGDPHVMARAAVSQTRWATPGRLSDADVEALAFLVLVQATRSAQEDLKAVMGRVKAIDDSKAQMREALNRLQQDADRTHHLPASTPCQPPECGRSSATLESTPRSALGARRPMVAGGQATTVGELRGFRDAAKDELDAMTEMGEMESLRLQMAMDRLSKLMSTLSNILKKISDTAGSIIQNIK
jgi:hypothetical protein